MLETVRNPSQRQVRGLFGFRFALGVVLTAWAPRALAAEGCVGQTGAARDGGGFRHDGFFARAEASVALLSERITPRAAHAGRTEIQAWGQSSQLLVGGTPWPGLVIGGFLGAARLDPAFTENGVRVVPDDDSVKISLVRLGPFVDWYPDPLSGFHAQLGIALAVQIESDEKGNPIEPAATGPAVSFGVGHEWFLARSWSLGLFGRLGFARLARSVDGRDERTLSEALELGLTSTYH